MFKPLTLLIIAIIFASSYWFYQKINTPQINSGKRVTNLPWQITIVNPSILHVFDLNIGKATLGDAVNVLKSEYNLAWFENPDESLSLEAYFFRVNLSGLRAKVILELDTKGINKDYLIKNSGKPEILQSRSIKYPLDDLAKIMSTRSIKSLTYVPKSSVEASLLKDRFGTAEETIIIDQNTEFWLYPHKGLLITLNKKGKEAFQYIPTADFDRLQKTTITPLKK